MFLSIYFKLSVYLYKCTLDMLSKLKVIQSFNYSRIATLSVSNKSYLGIHLSKNLNDFDEEPNIVNNTIITVISNGLL